MVKYFLPALLLVLTLDCLCFAQAPSTTPPNAIPANATPANTAPPGSSDVVPSGRSLQTGVRKIELSLEKLRDVGLDLKHLMKSASSLYDEVAIRPVALMTEPEVIGTTVINVPIGVQPIGPVQPTRKDRLDLAMNSVRPIVALLKTNVDEFLSGEQQLDISSDTLEELKPKLKDWVDRVTELSAQEKQLETLTAGPDFDSNRIADGAVAMEKNVKQLDAVRRDIYKIIRKRARRDEHK